MATEDERFLQRLLATFRVEADEHLSAMSSLLLTLEKPLPADQMSPLVETLFREAHSLKGAARAVNRDDIEAVCQVLESVLAALKQQEIALSPAFFDAMYRAVDVLGNLLSVQDEGKRTSVAPDFADTLRRLENVQRGGQVSFPMERPRTMSVASPGQRPMQASSTLPGDAQTDQTVRISTAKLGALLLQAEELLAFKFGAAHLAEDLHALHGELVSWKKTWGKTVRDARAMRRVAQRHNDGRGERRLPAMDRLLETIERDEFFAKAIVDRFALLERNAGQERRALAGMVDNLLEDMKQTLMLPFSSLLEMFPKMVRDLAHDSGKEADLMIDGAAIEIDRRILEHIKDPLTHLVRNAIDHGIETPAERMRLGKAPRGSINIEIAPKEGNKIELVVRDDGRGISREQVTDTALRMELIAPEMVDSLSEQEVLALIFESGLSTSPMLTDMSGRGLGLAIVREKVERLDGNVAVENPESGGTRFRMLLPSMLATFRGLLVAVGEHQYVLPSRNVERVARVPLDVVMTVENRETITLDQHVLSLVRLADALGLAMSAVRAAPVDYLVVAVLASGGTRIAFAVDEVLGDQEVLVKNLGPQLVRVPNVAGATVLGAGRVVAILNVADLMKSALKVGLPMVLDVSRQQTPRQSLLVVEDSITSRSLLKNILENAGYDVAVAVDGIDAMTKLNGATFDLVVSDVEMPRMDGFDLTAKIRADQRLSGLPVVLVTALDTREHKERGIDVGANAYIVKSSFDQGNLLDAIRRLI